MRTAIVVSVLALSLAPRAAHALGTKVLIYSQGGSSSLGYGGLAQELSHAGATQVDQSGWPADLATGYRVVFLMDCGPLSPSQLTDLQAFVAGGGGVVMAAEPIDGVSGLNQVAAALNVGERLVDAQVYDGCNEAPVRAQVPLTDQVTGISVSRSTLVSGGMVIAGDPGADVVTYEGTVLLAGDSNIFSDSSCLGCCGQSPATIQFWRNIYNVLPMVQSSGGGDDAGTSGGGDDSGAQNPPQGSSGGCAFGGRGAFSLMPLACALLLVAIARSFRRGARRRDPRHRR